MTFNYYPLTIRLSSIDDKMKHVSIELNIVRNLYTLKLSFQKKHKLHKICQNISH